MPRAQRGERGRGLCHEGVTGVSWAAHTVCGVPAGRAPPAPRQSCQHSCGSSASPRPVSWAPTCQGRGPRASQPRPHTPFPGRPSSLAVQRALSIPHSIPERPILPTWATEPLGSPASPPGVTPCPQSGRATAARAAQAAFGRAAGTCKGSATGSCPLCAPWARRGCRVGLLVGAVPLPPGLSHPRPLPSSPGEADPCRRGGRSPPACRPAAPSGVREGGPCLGAAPLAEGNTVHCPVGTQCPSAPRPVPPYCGQRRGAACRQRCTCGQAPPPPGPCSSSVRALGGPNPLASEPSRDTLLPGAGPCAASPASPRGPSQGQPRSGEAGLAAAWGVWIGLRPGMDSFV